MSEQSIKNKRKLAKYKRTMQQLTNVEISDILSEYAASKSQKKVAQMFGISPDTVKELARKFRTDLQFAKQILAMQCLDDALRTKRYITPEKLRTASAHSLVSMRRESVYTAIMLLQNQLIEQMPNVNLVQIILDTQKLIAPEQKFENVNISDVGITDEQKK